MVRVCWCGFLGSGKTLGAVKEAYRYHLQHPNRKIYSNVPLSREIFGNSYVPITSIKELFVIDEPCFILLDEAWFIADSRTIQSPENKALSVLLLRSRKMDWTVATTQQWYTQLDLRLRFITDLWVFPQFYTIQGILQEDIYDLMANYICTRYYDATPYFEMYDTLADPTTLNIEEEKEKWNRKHVLDRFK